MQTIQRSLRRGWGQACVCRRGWVTARAVKSESCVRFYYKSEMTAPNLGIQGLGEDEANHQTILYFIAPLAFLIFQAHKPPASQFFIPHIWIILLKGPQWVFLHVFATSDYNKPRVLYKYKSFLIGDHSKLNLKRLEIDRSSQWAWSYLSCGHGVAKRHFSVLLNFHMKTGGARDHTCSTANKLHNDHVTVTGKWRVATWSTMEYVDLSMIQTHARWFSLCAGIGGSQWLREMCA